jgi:vitamin B12 transporter
MKLVFTRARLAVLPLALSAAFPSFAQNTSAGTLQDVVVTATRNPQLLSSVAAHTTVITREDIENSQSIDVVALLEREVSLQRVQYGGIGTVSNVFLRGLPALDTLVLVDGVPQLGQDAVASVGLENMMLDNIERIEIVRGNVSAIYGSGAIGGVIQIFTRKAQKAPSFSLMAEAGPRGTGKLAAQTSTTAGNTAISVGASHLTTEGFPTLNAAQNLNANQNDHGYQNNSSNVSISHKVNEDHLIGVQTTQSQGMVRFESNYGIPTDTNSSITTTNNTNLFTDDTFGNLHSRLSFGTRSQSTSTFNTGSYTATTGSNTRVESLDWVITNALGSNWLATAGFNGQSQHIDTTSADPADSLYNKDRDTHAVFAGLEGNFGPVSLQINGRNDSVGDWKQSTGYLGGGYALTDAFKVIASVSTAFNAPPLGYLYDTVYGGNPALQPELAHSNEVSFQYASGGQWVRVTYFDTRIENQLNYDLTSFTFTNLARTHNTGVELSYKGNIGDTKLSASLTGQNPVDELTGQTLARRAKTLISLGATQPIAAWRLGADLHYVDQRNDANPPNPSKTLAAYTVLDLTAAYTYSKEIKFTARLANASDQNYQNAYGYNQEPRSLYLGAVWTPKF